MNNDQLCKWLKENSSGAYRPAAEAAAIKQERKRVTKRG